MITILLQQKYNFVLIMISILCFFTVACNDRSNEEPLPIHCNNGLYDGNEKGIDCGGSCPTNCCENKKFDANLGEKGIDCGGKCPTNCCANGIVDTTNGETDIDCGGLCPPCKLPPSPTPSPIKKELEKDLNELAKQKDRKESRRLAKMLNKKYEAAQIVVVGKETKTYSIRDYTKNLALQEGTNIKIAVQNVQINDNKLNVATLKENYDSEPTK